MYPESFVPSMLSEESTPVGLVVCKVGECSCSVFMDSVGLALGAQQHKRLDTPKLADALTALCPTCEVP